MPEQINELRYKETKPNKSGDFIAGVEVVVSPEMKRVGDQLQDLQTALSADGSITVQQVLDLEQSLDKLTVNIEGEQFSLKDLPALPEMRRNLEIFDEIKKYDIRRRSELTFITPKIASILQREAAIQTSQGIDLGKVKKMSDAVIKTVSFCHSYVRLGITSLSDKASEYLSNTRKIRLAIPDVAEMSDIAVENLSRINGELKLGLVSLSPKAAESLSRHTGVLYLDNLVTIPDQVLEVLIRHPGSLGLDGLQNISPSQAAIFGTRQDLTGFLGLGGVATLSDEAAENLSRHTGNLALNKLTVISPAGIKKLANHEGSLEIDDTKIKEAINKIKNPKN